MIIEFDHKNLVSDSKKGVIVFSAGADNPIDIYTSRYWNMRHYKVHVGKRGGVTLELQKGDHGTLGSHDQEE